MPSTICAWGNSHAVRIPKNILSALSWTGRESIEITAENEAIVIRKAKHEESLADLFRDYKGNYKCQEMDWGPAVGREVW